jgi:hypothetical protein
MTVNERVPDLVVYYTVEKGTRTLQYENEVSKVFLCQRPLFSDINMTNEVGNFVINLEQGTETHVNSYNILLFGLGGLGFQHTNSKYKTPEGIIPPNTVYTSPIITGNDNFYGASGIVAIVRNETLTRTVLIYFVKYNFFFCKNNYIIFIYSVLPSSTSSSS